MPNDGAVSSATRVYATEWFALPALALETAALRVITVPTLGAKIVSIYDRDAEREWLLPPKAGQLLPAAYGASFVEQDMSGWDEMFPTIDRCAYPAPGAAFGARLPDHGEVWSLAWTQDADDDAIRLSVRGRALPYTLTRTMRASGERSVRLSYEVVNTGAEPLCALWAAHPQFAVDTETRILLPETVSQVVNVLPTDELPVVGQMCDWAEARTQSGQPLRLDRIRSASAQTYRKVYLPPDAPVSWAGLQQADGSALRLSWDAGEIPYLGIWVDEGVYNPAPTAALEPATGYYDSLARAWDNQRALYLAPGIPACWSLEVGVI